MSNNRFIVHSLPKKRAVHKASISLLYSDFEKEEIIEGFQNCKGCNLSSFYGKQEGY